MSTNSDDKTQLTQVAQALGAILGIPLALFTIVNNIFESPLVSLTVAIVTALLASVWLGLSRKINFMQIAIGWLALAVIILLGFVIWPRTMTVEGFIYDTDHNPISSKEVRFFDYTGRIYETETNSEGYYQFIDVPSGKYRIQVQSNEVEGETKGMLVRVVSQNLVSLVPNLRLGTHLPGKLCLPTGRPAWSVIL